VVAAVAVQELLVPRQVVHLLHQEVLEVMDYQHFKVMLEFLHLMEHLDQHPEDILLAVEVVGQELPLL
jgi:hypothetical protein